LGLVLAAAWQCFLVHGLYEGEWSALFYTGSAVALPPVIAAESPRRAPDPIGFDGQYYHVIAHDPLIPSDAAQFVDNSRLRWRRILAPGLAWLLALGTPGAIDFAFFAVILAFTCLGVYWSAQFAARNGFSPWGGLAFLLLPATLISVERMTVDVALAALCAGFAVLAAESGSWLYLVLALAPLARETGIALAGAWGIVQLAGGKARAALGAGLTLVPLAVWSLYVQSRTPSDATSWFGAIPLGGLIARTLHPFPDAAPSLGLKLAGGLEYVAILGVWAALALVVVELWRSPKEPLALASAITLAIFVFLAKEDIWQHSYGFARTLSPALLLLGMLGLRERRPILALPWALAAPRVLYQAILLIATAARG
jgi:hypothetical protein